MSLPRWVGLTCSALTVLVAASAVGDRETLDGGTADRAVRAMPAAAGSGERSLYIVQVDGAPAASYEGGVAGIPATRARGGGKLDRRTWNYQAYRQHLRTKRTDVLHAAGVDADRTVAEYSTAFNGFAARLTGGEVAALRRTAGVFRVWKNEIRKADTVSTPDLLGLSGPDGAWTTRFGDPTRAGEGVIVGVIDTGYWPENPSFAALPEPRPDAALIDEKWNADGVDKCDEGVEQPVACNNKVIGARWYNASSLSDFESEYESPRDYNGHGSHTASTAAGNHAVPATINGIAVGPVSGMAPAARLAIYKALWQQPDGEGSGGTVDLVQAIEDAVTDGVDVINYSISGSSQFVVDAVEIAFFHAAAAGVFVATSAGNSGPGASTVAHNAPWTTTVAASTHDRGSTKSFTLGNAATYSGVGQGPAVPASPLVDSVNAGLAGADAAQVDLCYSGTLDPAKVTGKIVLCKRGGNARTDKSKAVKDAGGVGMILYNPTINSLNADYHFVPTVHVGPTEGAAVKAYLAATTGRTAALSAAVTGVAQAPAMAPFSSAGPELASGGDLLKPDITAPGVDVIAAVSPSGHHGSDYDAVSGTSMAGPHIAGVGALLRAAYPTWSPTAIKSAIMTTAGLLDNAGKVIQRADADGTPLDYGAGHVRARRAFDPGLVYDSAPEDWIKYGCGTGQFQLVTAWCETTGAIDPSDLNYPSIAVGDLPGRQLVSRTVTNVTDRTSVYVAKVQAPTGFTVKVTPATITVRPGTSATFKVEINRTDATYDAWAFGALTWTDLRGHAVRSPIAIRPVAISAPADISATTTGGETTIAVRGGYKGTLTAKPYGLVASTPQTKRLVGGDLGFSSTAPAASATVHKFTVTAPEDSKGVRFATYDAEHVAGSDVDLYVYRNGKLVGSSLSGTSDEQLTFTAAGIYDVYVVQFALPANVPAQDVTVHSFVVPATTAGNLTVTPPNQPITPNATVSVTVRWTGLTAGKHYLGVVQYGDASATRASTFVIISP